MTNWPEAAGIDPLEFRLLNALRDGHSTVTGLVFERGGGHNGLSRGLEAPLAGGPRQGA